MKTSTLRRMLLGLLVLASVAGASTHPKIGYDTSWFNFVTHPSAAPQSTTIHVYNAGGGTLNWQIVGGAPWLTVSPLSGVNAGTLTATVDPAGLWPGRYESSFKIRALGAVNSPQRVKAVLDVVTDSLLAGFRASRYGVDPFPTPQYWAQVGSGMASRFSGSGKGCVWIVGVYLDNGDCELNFPTPGGAHPYIHFLNEDQNEAYLSYFDTQNISVWLQVEPGRALVPELIELVLRRYGHHPCVKGFGVDVEWFKTNNIYPEGKRVGDFEAKVWSTKVRSFNPAYSLFLKHWLIEKMPATYRAGLWFIDDSQEFVSLAQMVDEFRVWGKHFWPSSVGFQFGYEADRPWWSLLADPPMDIGDPILALVPNTFGLFWVDFTIKEIFP